VHAKTVHYSPVKSGLVRRAQPKSELNWCTWGTPRLSALDRTLGSPLGRWGSLVTFEVLENPPWTLEESQGNLYGHRKIPFLKTDTARCHPAMSGTVRGYPVWSKRRSEWSGEARGSPERFGVAREGPGSPGGPREVRAEELTFELASKRGLVWSGEARSGPVKSWDLRAQE
jgi:hypothetical protein